MLCKFWAMTIVFFMGNEISMGISHEHVNINDWIHHWKTEVSNGQFS